MNNYEEIIDAFKQDPSIENIGAVNNAIDEQKEFKPGEYKLEWINFVSTIIDIALAHYERDKNGKYRKHLINLINNCLNNGKSFGTKTENNAHVVIQKSDEPVHMFLLCEFQIYFLLQYHD